MKKYFYVIGVGEVILVIVLVLYGLFVFFNSDDWQIYESSNYNFLLQYPDSYILQEQKDLSPEHKLGLVLIEDTTEHRDLLAGRNTEPREGPVSINVDVYANVAGLSTLEWILGQSTWALSDQELEDISIHGRPGLAYYWDGLYLGKSLVVKEGDEIYLFSVTWLSPSDSIVVDFENILNQFKFINE